MITTFTPNPSLDRTLEIAAFERGAVVRSSSAILDPAGKGINVARALSHAGIEVRAVFPVGGVEGAEVIRLLSESDIELITVPIKRPVRANVILIEPDGTATEINERGPELTKVEVAALSAVVLGAAAGSDWAVLSGSLPPGVSVDLYAGLIEKLHAIGVKVALDTSGPALEAALTTGPDLIKPNLKELEIAIGRPITTLGEAFDAAAALVARGVKGVLASLGPVGALYYDANTKIFARAAEVTVRSVVGAGDSTLAGFIAINDGPVASLERAVRWGSAAVSLPGSQIPTPDDVANIHIAVDQHPDLTMVLTH